MFPGGDQPDMVQLLQQAQQMQQQLVQAQEELAQAQVQGSAGGGLVTATVSGAGEVVDLRIDPKAYDPDDSDAMSTIADLVLAAIRDASRGAAELQTNLMAPLTDGLDLGDTDAPGLPRA